MFLGLKNHLKRSKKQIVLFAEERFDDPFELKPSSRCMPNWFKKLGRDIPNSFPPDSTVKRCIPFLEAMTQGFTMCLWSDLYVTVSKVCYIYDKDGNHITHENGVPVQAEYNESPNELIGKDIALTKIASVKDLGRRVNAQFSNLSPPLKYFDIQSHHPDQIGPDWLKDLKCQNILKFTAPYKIQTPKGYSTYFKPPANDFTNTFKIIEGFVDTDRYAPETNFPFVWVGSEDGRFVIPSGTPIAQAIVIKREKHKVINSVYSEGVELNSMRLYRSGQDRYRRFFWHKAKDNG